MKPLKQFDEFLKKGIVKKRSKNISRANYLIEESERRNAFLDDLNEKIGLSDANANYFIENIYDVLISLDRAILLKQGFSSAGTGAHEAEVSYLRELKFSEADVRFMNEIRHFRNSILYYGKHFDSEHGEKALTFYKKIYPQLLS